MKRIFLIAVVLLMMVSFSAFAEESGGSSDSLIHIGNTITFGTYPQTAEGTDKTPIEWIVLDVQQDSTALLVSRFGLDAVPYNADKADVTWETCSLRAWLNGDFLSAAFTVDEQEAIVAVNVDNSASQCFSDWAAEGGNDTQDQIFLLSYAEAWQYFASDSDRVLTPTAYAEAKGGQWTWWLRSPGVSQKNAASVGFDGSLCFAKVAVTSNCIRPAMWINLESGIF